VVERVGDGERVGVDFEDRAQAAVECGDPGDVRLDDLASGGLSVLHPGPQGGDVDLLDVHARSLVHHPRHAPLVLCRPTFRRRRVCRPS
jgi:hypothetical protein